MEKEEKILNNEINNPILTEVKVNNDVTWNKKVEEIISNKKANCSSFIEIAEIWDSGEYEIDSNRLCRACANATDNLIPIFDNEGVEHNLQVKIKHLPIEICVEDILPTKLCFQCASVLISYHDLYTTCIEANRILSVLLNSSYRDKPSVLPKKESPVIGTEERCDIDDVDCNDTEIVCDDNIDNKVQVKLETNLDIVNTFSKDVDNVNGAENGVNTRNNDTIKLLSVVKRRRSQRTLSGPVSPTKTKPGRRMSKAKAKKVRGSSKFVKTVSGEMLDNNNDSPIAENINTSQITTTKSGRQVKKVIKTELVEDNCDDFLDNGDDDASTDDPDYSADTFNPNTSRFEENTTNNAIVSMNKINKNIHPDELSTVKTNNTDKNGDDESQIKINNKMIFCNYCGRLFYYKNKLIEHIKKLHEKSNVTNAPFKCINCNLFFATKSILKTHITESRCDLKNSNIDLDDHNMSEFYGNETVTNEKGVKENADNKQFIASNYLSNLNRNDNDCIIDNQLLSSKKCYKQDIVHDHDKSMDRFILQEVNKFNCQLCGRVFNNHDNVQSHLISDHFNKNKDYGINGNNSIFGSSATSNLYKEFGGEKDKNDIDGKDGTIIFGNSCKKKVEVSIEKETKYKEQIINDKDEMEVFSADRYASDFPIFNNDDFINEQIKITDDCVVTENITVTKSCNKLIESNKNVPNNTNNKNNKLFYCKICSMLLKNKRELKNHCCSGNSLKITKVVSQDISGVTDTKICSMNQSLKDVDKCNNDNVKRKENLKCSYCDKIYARKTDLMKHHGKMHLNVSVHVSVIESESENPNAKDKNIIVQVQKVDNSSNNDVGIKSDENLKQNCVNDDVLRFTDTSASGVEAVLKRSRIQVNGAIIYRCNRCSKNLLTKRGFIRHLRIHTNERPFTCHICGKQYRSSSDLSRHSRCVHDGIKNYSCDICGKKFASTGTRNDHRRTHTGERPYVCHTCGKSFPTPNSIYIHRRTHTDFFPYHCTTCGKCFRRRQQLIHHTRTHTGEKPYECEPCGKRFGVKEELSRHLYTHSNEKPFSCNICGQCFGQKRYLKTHFKKFHSLPKGGNNDSDYNIILGI